MIANLKTNSMNVKRTKLCLCRSLLLMAGLLFAVASFAQDLTVKGKVTDTTGETVIGANVTVKGTTNGIITDIDGNYTLSGVKPSSVLVFSFIGYKTQEIPCSGRQEKQSWYEDLLPVIYIYFLHSFAYLLNSVLNQMHLSIHRPEGSAQVRSDRSALPELPDGTDTTALLNAHRLPDFPGKSAVH